MGLYRRLVHSLVENYESAAFINEKEKKLRNYTRRNSSDLRISYTRLFRDKLIVSNCCPLETEKYFSNDE